MRDIKATKVKISRYGEDGRESHFPIGLNFDDGGMGQISFSSIVNMGEIIDTHVKLYSPNRKLIKYLFISSAGVFVASFILSDYSLNLNLLTVLGFLMLIPCVLELVRKMFASTKRQILVETSQAHYKIHSCLKSEHVLLDKIRDAYRDYINRLPNEEEDTVRRMNAVLSNIVANKIVTETMLYDLRKSNRLKEFTSEIGYLSEYAKNAKEFVVQASQENNLNQKKGLIKCAIKSAEDIKVLAASLPVNQIIWNSGLDDLIATLSSIL